MTELPILPVPLVTPLKRDGRVDVAALARLVRHVLQRGADALFVLATTGEFAGLPDLERVRAVEAVLEAAAGDAPVWAGVGDTSTVRVRQNLDALDGLDVGAYVVCAPFYLVDLSQTEVTHHFVEVAHHASGPIVAYNIPQITQVTIEPATIAALAEQRYIVAVKDSSLDFIRFQQLLTLTEGMAHFATYHGQERLAAAALLAGAHGIVSGMSNLVPQVLVALHTACRNGALPRARELQRWLSDLSEAISSDHWLRGVKAALELQGIGQLHTLAPRSSALADADRDRVARVLASSPVSSPRRDAA